MRAGLLFVVFSILFFSRTDAQISNEADFKKKFGLVDGYLYDGDYFKALPLAKELYAYDSTNANVNYMLGTAYLGADPDRKKAIQYLEQAIIISPPMPMYKEDDYKERNPPGIAYYNLAKAYHFIYRFEDAISNFYNYRSFVDIEDKESYGEVKRQIEYAENAKLLIEQPVNIKVQKLQSINSKYEDYSPVISADGNTLIFTSRREGTTGGKMFQDGTFYEDIYISKKERGKWNTPRTIGSNINTDASEASIGLSPDGQQLFIYKDDNGDGNIYMSKLVGTEWSKPEKLGGDINTSSWETHATVSYDGQNLFFVSNRSGGFGGRDIYKVSLLPDGTWGKAENLGPTINTPFEEEAPFFSADGTLIFSSQGHNSMGGFDIFKSQNMNGVWSTPENIGYPINTPEDDVFFVTTPDGHFAYYSSKMEGGMGGKDIYLIELEDKKTESLTVMKGVVILENSPEINVSISVADARTNAVTGIYKPNKTTGSYIFILQPGAEYDVTYESDGYEKKVEKVVVPENSGYSEITKAVLMDPVIFGKPTGIVQEEKKVEEVVSSNDSLKKEVENLEAQLLAVEEKKKADELAKSKAAEEAKLAADKKAAEEAKILADKKAAEQAKLAADKKAAEEAKLAADKKAAEEAKLAADKKAAEEAKIAADKKAAEEAKLAADKKAAEEAKLAADKKAAEEAKLAADKKAAEEAKLAADKKAAEEAKLAADKKAAEEAKIAADKKAAEEAKLAADKKAAEEAKLAADKKAAEEAKLAADKKAAEEAKLAADKKVAEEAKLAADKKAAEEAKLAADKKAAEEAKLAADKKAAEEAKLAADKKAAEEAKLAADKKAAEEAKLAAEEAKLAADKKAAEEAKLAADKKAAEEAKLAADKKAAEEAKLAADKKAAEEAKLAADKKAAEEAKLAADKKAAEEAKLAADKKAAEEAKLAADKKAAEEAKLAADKKAAAEAKLAADKKAAEEARIAEEKKKADELAKTKAAEEAKLAADKKAAEDEKIKLAEKKQAFEDSLVRRKEEIVKRLEELKKLQTQKLAEENQNKAAVELKAQEEKKKEDERKAAEQKLADDKRAATEAANEAKLEAIRKAEEKVNEEKRVAAEAAEKAKAEEEAKKQREVLDNAKTIDELKKMNQALIAENEKLKKQIAESNKRIDQLTEKVNSQNDKYDELLKKFEEMQKQQKYQNMLNKTDFPSFEKGQTVVLKNIFFDYNLSIIKNESAEELQKLYVYMRDNKDVKVEISGHTDSHGNDEYNIQLSRDRANAVMRYLERKGIDGSRLKSVGMGEKQPIAINENPDGTDNPDGRKLNRRIEIRILNPESKDVKIEDIAVPKDLKLQH